MIVQKWIDRIVKEIVEFYDPDEIILFGSYARQSQTFRSDIDLLIIKDSVLRQPYRGLEILDHLKRYPISFDVIFRTPDELENAIKVGDSFINLILKMGRSLYKRH